MSCLDQSSAMSQRLRFGKIGQPKDPAGTSASGRITRLFVGQAYGYIRLRNGVQVFFHRSDLQDVSTFNRLQVGDLVVFDLIDDAVSGARAIHVTPKRADRR
jgi:cold shock CspA family protein